MPHLIVERGCPPGVCPRDEKENRSHIRISTSRQIGRLAGPVQEKMVGCSSKPSAFCLLTGGARESKLLASYLRAPTPETIYAHHFFALSWFHTRTVVRAFLGNCFWFVVHSEHYTDTATNEINLLHAQASDK